jgi:hypothetical protein
VYQSVIRGHEEEGELGNLTSTYCGIILAFKRQVSSDNHPFILTRCNRGFQGIRSDFRGLCLGQNGCTNGLAEHRMPFLGSVLEFSKC